MKRTLRSIILASGLGLAAGLHAQIIASDNAADPVYTGGNIHGLNGGFGFSPWNCSPTTNSGSAGNFQFTSSQNGSGTSGDIDSSGKAWGHYANSGNISTLQRPIAVSMSGVRTVTVDWDNGWVDNGSTVLVKIGSYAFGFTGGQANYWFDIGMGAQDTGLPFTADGIHLKLVLNGTGGYNFSASPNNSTSVWATANFSGAQIPTYIISSNANAGFNASNNVYLNNLKIVAPEPSAVIAILTGLGALVCRRRTR